MVASKMPLARARAAPVQKEKRDIGTGIAPLPRIRTGVDRSQVKARERSFNPFGRLALRSSLGCPCAFNRKRARSSGENRNASDQAQCERGRLSPANPYPLGPTPRTPYAAQLL